MPLSTQPGQSKTEQLALYIGAIAIIIPGLMISGLLPPELNPLGTSAWVAIAIIGSTVAGVIGFPRQRLRGSIAGAITGGGALLGLLLHVYVRTSVFSADSVYNLELMVAGVLGSIPGIILIAKWVKPTRA